MPKVREGDLQFGQNRLLRRAGGTRGQDKLAKCFGNVEGLQKNPRFDSVWSPMTAYAARYLRSCRFIAVMFACLKVPAKNPLPCCAEEELNRASIVF